MLSLLRWLIGIGCILGLSLFALILTVGKGFDVYRSGAGSEDLAQTALVIAIPTLLLTMLLTAIGIGGRPLLHITATATLAALAGILYAVARTNPGEAAIYAAFLVLWLIFYALNWK